MLRVTIFSLLCLVCLSTSALDLQGKIVDKVGEALPGATVYAIQERSVKSVQTSEGGEFAFSELQPVPADLVAWKEGHAASGVRVDVIGVADVLIGLPESGELRLVVKEPTFEPIAGARVTRVIVQGLYTIPVEDLESAGFPSPVSGDDGALVFGNLPKVAHVDVTVRGRSRADSSIEYVKIDGDPQTVILYPGITLRGRITSEEGSPVSMARVSATLIKEEGFGESTEVLTDPEGYYHVTLAAGQYYVAARHPGFASPPPATVELVDDETSNTADLVLPVPHIIEGSVSAPDASPMPGVAVSFWIETSPYEEVLTQKDGTFRLTTPGVEGYVRITPPPGLMTEGLQDIPVRGELKESTKISPVKLVALPEIDGVVVNEAGDPQPQVLVASRDIEPRLFAITDTEGRFRIQLLREPEQKRAEFRAEHGLRFLRTDFSVDLKNPHDLRVTLAPFEPDLGPQPPAWYENDLTDLVGAAAPPLECAEWINGDPVALDQLRGKVIVLAFWGGFDDRDIALGWLEELKATHALLSEVDTVAFLSVHDSGTEKEKVARYAEEYGVSFPVGHDTEPGKTFAAYRVRNIPQTVLIDKRGNLRCFQTAGRLLELIKGLRREPDQ